ncbi:MAG: hypothetical protein KA175_01305 [Flavobacteriales bacterium]|nr:hypothetical protein [Flavobacteriales bacterium]
MVACSCNASASLRIDSYAHETGLQPPKTGDLVDLVLGGVAGEVMKQLMATIDTAEMHAMELRGCPTCIEG